MVQKEFEAVVLAAGSGTRLPELSKEQPKCLLPVGPYPLLWYPLYTLQKHNFDSVIVIVFEDEKNQIQLAMERTPLLIKIDFVSIPSDSDWGTADSLRHIHEKIKCNLIVMSCDVITNASLYPMINKFRQHNASFAMFLFNNFETVSTVPGPKSKNKLDRDLIGIQDETERLLFFSSVSDFEETLDLDGHLLRKYEKFNLYSRLVDSHIYVIKKWIIDYLKAETSFSTLKGEFLPYIVKKQMSRNTTTNTANDQIPSETGGANTKSHDILQFAPNPDVENQIINASSYYEVFNRKPYYGDIIRCYAVRMPKGCLGVRVNTTINYYSINMKIFSFWDDLIMKSESNKDNSITLTSSKAIIKSTQMKNITVSENATLSEKTSLSNSIFGENCIIHPKVKIANSIVMSHATIEECCTIENSIICPKAVIKKGTSLINCIVGPNFVVEEGTKKQAAHLTCADGYMEIE